jgi:hypothetical protein
VYPDSFEAFSPKKRSSSNAKDNIYVRYGFLFFRGIFALLDPDPDFEFGSGSRDPIELGSGSTTLVAG